MAETAEKKELKSTKDSGREEFIEIYGAREHNLRNFDLKIPRGKLVVITGISGSGKSSLAFDTIYAEGQRRYMESFSAYARSFIGDMERPDVDKIEGLSPVISIEQKTTSRNPRSTVGTTTEIYDFLRLLYARAGKAVSYVTGEDMIKRTEDEIIRILLEKFNWQKLVILAPVIKGRKGHYRELFVNIRKMGYQKARIDGEIVDLTPKMQLDRYKTHDIEIVVDRLIPSEKEIQRLRDSTKEAMRHGKGIILVQDEKGDVHHFSRHLMCPTSGVSYDDPAPNNFSFNSPYGACPVCDGLGYTDEITKESIISNDSLSISRGAIEPIGEFRNIWIFQELDRVLKKFDANISTPIKDISDEGMKVLMRGTRENEEPEEDEEIKKYNFQFEGLINYLLRHAQNSTDQQQRWLSDYMIRKECHECHGQRLKIESRHFYIAEKNISELAEMDISTLKKWFEGIESKLDDRQNVIATEVLKEIRKRINFLLDVGLDYLTLNRPLRTLSGGESQRIRLATQIGTQLVGVMYILDEPSIGLHQRDNQRLIDALKRLRDNGNSVIVVEHDKDMMLASDYIVDIGPGAGRRGGDIVGEGDPTKFTKGTSLTAKYLNDKEEITIPSERRKGSGKFIELTGATGHNLQKVDLKLPLGKLTCVTGVSGSGKSSLIHETLHPILSRHFYRSKREPLAHKEVKGIEHIDKVIEVDQKPIGRTPRSNPATYTGVFSDIRTLFTQLPEAKIRGYKPGRFSFNVKGGRCETCEGGGVRLIEMDFLPNVHVPCETCKGKRYNRETLEVRYKGKSISDVLEMTVNEAVEFFENQPRIVRKIETLKQVGLGYITLGQHATTLSGGEAQRVKLATELSKKDTGKTLYILDEPSTGLHFEDIRHLMDVVDKLVNKGNTVLIIEHNMDIIKVADHIIDLGPEGGTGGGKIIAQGTPEEVIKVKESHTGHFLKTELN